MQAGETHENPAVQAEHVATSVVQASQFVGVHAAHVFVVESYLNPALQASHSVAF